MLSGNNTRRQGWEKPVDVVEMINIFSSEQKSFLHAFGVILTLLKFFESVQQFYAGTAFV